MLLGSYIGYRWELLTSTPDFLLEDLNRIESLLELELSYRIQIAWNQVLFSSALKGLTKLTKLDLQISLGVSGLKGFEGVSRYHKCKALISRAPNLKSLTISVHSWEHSWPGVAPALSTNVSFSPDEVLPPLETLDLKNYTLGAGGLSDIENRLDVSKLKRLHLQGVHLGGLNAFVRNLLVNPQQISLKHFVIQRSYRFDETWRLDAQGEQRWHATLNDFLQSFVGLESLTLYGDSVSKLPSLSAIMRHGETLRQLKIHSSESVRISPIKPNLSFTAEMLRAIRESCPHLRELAIDVDRHHYSEVLVSNGARPMTEIDTS